MIYFFEVWPGVVKIGYSARSVERRFAQASNWCPNVRVLCVLPEGTSFDERMIHIALADLHIARELFTLNEDLRSVCATLSDGCDWTHEIKQRFLENARARARERSADPTFKARVKRYVKGLSPEQKEHARILGLERARRYKKRRANK